MSETTGYNPEEAEAQKVADAQTAESGMPGGAVLETQLKAAEAKAESSSNSAEARLGLQVAERQVAGLNTTEVVGARAKLALGRIESMLKRRSDRLGVRAETARKAKEKHSDKVGKIRDKWTKIAESKLKTDVVSQLAAGIDGDIKVKRGKLKETGEWFQGGFDKMKTWYQESRTRVNAKKESQRGKSSERYKKMADQVSALSASIRTEVGDLADSQEENLRQVAATASENQVATQQAEANANTRFDTAMGPVGAVGEAGRAGVLAKGENDTEGQREVVDQAAGDIVDVMNPQPEVAEAPAVESEPEDQN